MNNFHHGPLAIDKTQDEDGKDRYFIRDVLSGDWLGEPFDTFDLASGEARRMHELKGTDAS